MRIELQKLTLQNFKGIKSLAIPFGMVTDISGDNATGKTTVADAFFWLLFNKDSQERATFQIKTLDGDGQEIHGLEHAVEGEFTVDGARLELKKVYKEKWTKRKGEAQKVMTGHTTDYFVDEVPVKKSEYEERINALISEELFKLLSNPFYFPNMHWESQREALVAFCGDVTDETIIASDKALEPLSGLLDGKNIDDFKKVVASKRRALNKELETIPARIAELSNQIVEEDFTLLSKQIIWDKEKLEKINEQIADKSKVSDEELEEKERVIKAKGRMSEIKDEVRQRHQKVIAEYNDKLQEAESKLYKAKANLDPLEITAGGLENQIESLNRRRDNLREEWAAQKARTFEFDESESACPTCKRPFPDEEIEEKRIEMKANFEAFRDAELKEIQRKGKEAKAKVDELEAELKRTTEEAEMLEKQIAELEKKVLEIKNEKPNLNVEKELAGNAEYGRLASLVTEAERPRDLTTMADDGGLSIKKNDLEIRIEKLQERLAAKGQNERLEKRIDELKEDERRYANEIAKLEGQEFLCEKFTRAKVDMLESKINEQFEVVNFKLFNEQVNGGLSETCEATINGVPYSSANRAAQINAGLDIIRTLSKHYGYQVPVMIDNREAVNSLIAMDTQLINLRVTDDPELKVEVQQ
jgi:DNA repair exonuclease SbcCD ATPase subunit